MSIFVTCDKTFFETSYADRKLDGIYQEAARKRIPCHLVFSRAELEEYRDEYESDPSSLVIMEPTEARIEFWLKEYAGLPMHIILFANHEYRLLYGNYSCVMTDVAASTEEAVRFLQSRGCSRIALFGTNPLSGMDPLRIRAFSQITAPDGEPMIFGATQGGKVFTQSIPALLRSDQPVDAILVTTDFLAARLIKILDMLDPAWNERLLLLSFGNTLFSRLSRPSLSSVSIGSSGEGREIVSLHRLFRKDPLVSRILMTIRSEIIPRDTTRAEHPAGLVFSELNGDLEALMKETAYCVKVMALERMLLRCDRTDCSILLGICRGVPFETLSEQLYLTLSAIKYRAQGYRNTLGVKRTKELRFLLSSMISDTALEEYRDSLDR